jgi:hypothetical protein
MSQKNDYWHICALHLNVGEIDPKLCCSLIDFFFRCNKIKQSFDKYNFAKKSIKWEFCDFVFFGGFNLLYFYSNCGGNLSKDIFSENKVLLLSCSVCNR